MFYDYTTHCDYMCIYGTEGMLKERDRCSAYLAMLLNIIHVMLGSSSLLLCVFKSGHDIETHICHIHVCRFFIHRSVVHYGSISILQLVCVFRIAEALALGADAYALRRAFYPTLLPFVFQSRFAYTVDNSLKGCMIGRSTF